jgi:phage tail-like protein
VAIFREKPYSGVNFVVDLGNGETEGSEAGLVEVIFPDGRLHTFEYRNGNEKSNESRKLQTITRYENLILKRGVIGSLTWYNWWNATRNGDQSSARTIKISLLNEDHSAVVLAWVFRMARPVNYRFSPLNALEAEALTELLEVAFERFDLE